MSRPLRIEFAGACYHVMAHGNAREPIFLDDQDRQTFLDGVASACERFDWVLWAYCLMGNHYHLLVETRRGSLSSGMREINGTYTQAFNRRRRRVGHLLQGRFKAILIDNNSYLTELLRYLVLNPVRTGLCEVPRRARAWRTLAQYDEGSPDRDTAIRAAYASGGWTLAQIGMHFGLHYATISRIARRG